MVASYLFDKNNIRYLVNMVAGDSLFEAVLIWEKAIIGRIQYVIEPSDTLNLGNIEIFEDPILPRNSLWSLRPCQRPHRNFRQLGLGSAMLEYVIVQAQLLGVERITGYIILDDASKTPYLAEFYRRHGFNVVPVTYKSSFKAATISRDIQKP